MTEHLSALELGWDDILDKVEERYQLQVVPDMIRWPPAYNTVDTKAPPGQFGANLTHIPSSEGSSNSYSKKNRKCHECGKPGHFKRDCPELKSNGNGSGNGNRNHRNNPKTTPPASNETPIKQCNGEPVFEKEINGRTMQCAKCKRYTTTHNTGSHTGGKPNIAGQASYGLVPAPYLWMASISERSPMCWPYTPKYSLIVDEPLECSTLSSSWRASTPIWSSIAADIWSLSFPHLICASIVGLTLLLFTHFDVILGMMSTAAMGFANGVSPAVECVRAVTL